MPFEAVQLNIFVNEADWINQFTHLELWRANLGEGGPYEALTGDTWSRARIPNVSGTQPASPETGPSTPLVGDELQLRLQEHLDISVVFTGTDPLTFAQATAPALLKSFVLNGKLVIEGYAGASSSIRVVGGNAAPLLKLPTVEPESISFGLDARLVLKPNVAFYLFSDRFSTSTAFYKYRFYNNVSTAVSAFSAGFKGLNAANISPLNSVLGYVSIVDTKGAPRANQELLISNRDNNHILEGKNIISFSPSRILTNTEGYASITLVRGTSITVALAGTDLVRDIEVPTDTLVTSFNLLDPTKGVNDLFKVQVPDIDFAVRRSL